jgi:hypothetical protein
MCESEMREIAQQFKMEPVVRHESDGLKKWATDPDQDKKSHPENKITAQ